MLHLLVRSLLTNNGYFLGLLKNCRIAERFLRIYFFPGELGELAKAMPIKYLAAKFPE